MNSPFCLMMPDEQSRRDAPADYFFSACATATATATVMPTIGLLPETILRDSKDFRVFDNEGFEIGAYNLSLEYGTKAVPIYKPYRDEFVVDKGKNLTDASKLSRVLADDSQEDVTMLDVLKSVYSVETVPEKEDTHYFSVQLDGVDDNSKLLSYADVEDYLSQNAPVPYSPDFIWGKEIVRRLNSLKVMKQHNLPILRWQLFYQERYHWLFRIDRQHLWRNGFVRPSSIHILKPSRSQIVFACVDRDSHEPCSFIHNAVFFSLA